MELSPSQEATTCVATHEFPSISQNPEVHYHIHKSPSLANILSQTSTVHTIPSYFQDPFSLIVSQSLLVSTSDSKSSYIIDLNMILLFILCVI
jgi:hypothetical protein